MKNIINLILAITFTSVFTSCKKENGLIIKEPEKNTQYAHIVKKEHSEVTQERLAGNYAESIHGIPKIESVTLNDSTNHKLQIYMRYWPKADTSYMHLEWRQFNTINIFTSIPTMIDGVGPSFGFWHVFTDINNLNPNTQYEVRIIGINMHGTRTTDWVTYSTGY